MPTRLALIGGSGLGDLSFLERTIARAVTTPYGPPSSELLFGRIGDTEVVVLSRHGPEHTIPPHRINHRANLWALKEMGVRRIVAASSVGSLNRNLRPGTLVVPHDYLCLWDIPTFHDDRVVHVTPGLDEGIRAALVSAAKGKGIASRARAVYAQTRGPRLETKAEIRLLRDYADVVGMTMASEATLAAELALAYGSVCTVDNYAHGLTQKPLTYEAIAKAQRGNAFALAALLPSALPAVGAQENV